MRRYKYRYLGTEPARTGYPEASWKPGQEQWVDREMESPLFSLVDTKDEPDAPAAPAEVSGNA